MQFIGIGGTRRHVKKSDRIIAALALLSAAIIVVRVIGAVAGYDLIDMAVNATRPADAGGWPMETH
ncbi:hypothetical protein C9E91_08890 [Rhizobium sp. SEMIA4064]|nr:hypothetical protein C9E91_08890 [Rhizobium sp. SEMIA4064]